MENKQTKLCKYCKTEIPAQAKICPNCRKKQGPKIWLIVLIVIVALCVIGSIAGGGSSSAKTSSGTTAASSKVENITYTSYSVDDMMNDLTSNALNAQTKYKDQYVEITGRLGVIDSNGKYIALYAQNDAYAITGVQCYIKNDTQKQKVAQFSKNDTVTLKGKVTDVGEVIGYSLNIDEIE